MGIRAWIAAGIVGWCFSSSYCVSYSVEVLPPFGSSASLVVTGMNDSGWVTGYYDDGQYFKSLLWNGQEWLPIPGFSSKSTFAQGINNAGIVVGQSDLPTQLCHGFWFQNGIFSDVTPANRMGSAYGINDSGVICGFAYFNGIGTRAFVRSQGNIQYLGTLGGTSSMGYDINNSGLVIGMSSNASRVTEAFLKDASGMISIAPPGATWSSSQAINNPGSVVGNFKTAQGKNHGFFFNGTQSFDVGLISGMQELWLRDINNSGTAVGYGYIDDTHFVAVKFENGVLTDLSTEIDPSSPVQLGAAFAANNRGWIAALGSLDGINGVTVILKPIPIEGRDR
jgi:probable HAF family extracellular repeat protein